MPFNFNRINRQNAWLLGLILADGTIGIQQGKKVVKLYSKHKGLLEKIKNTYQIPYTVTCQRNILNVMYFIRFADSEFVDSIEKWGFKKDKTNLRIPIMKEPVSREFLRGFLKGKGSFFTEAKTGIHGFKVVFRSRVFINDIATAITDHCQVRVANPHCRKAKNVISCQIKYVGGNCEKIKRALDLKADQVKTVM